VALMRVSRILSLAGVASRRKAESAILAGEVAVNGATVRTLGTTADPERDDVSFRGRAVSARQPRTYLLLHKPRGYVCTRQDEKGRPTVLDLLPEAWRHVYPVGRLDLESEGLLLLTDDGDLCHHLTHPRYGVLKVYQVRVRGVPSPEVLQKLHRGLRLDGEALRVEEARVVRAAANAWLHVELREGRKHEIRRLLKALGHPVVRLRRVAIGPLHIKGLAAGHHRRLTELEVRRLRRIAVRDADHRPAAPRPSRPTPTGVKHAQAHHG
jgi:pseudouridine synthase